MRKSTWCGFFKMGYIDKINRSLYLESRNLSLELVINKDNLAAI